MDGAHNDKNKECPRSRADAIFGTECKCRNLNEVGDLSGQDFLDALTEAQRNGSYKGWTLGEMVGGPSVLPITVYDSDDPEEPIIKHECIAMTHNDHGRITEMTLMVTTPDGTTYQDFVPKGPPTDTP